MAVTLYKGPQTRVTRQIVRQALRGGLHPHVSFPPYRGVYEVIVDANAGPDSPIGVIRVGARSGRIIGASILLGDDGPTRRARGAVAVRRLIREITR